MKTRLCVYGLMVWVAASTAAWAGGVAVGVKVGTLGLGADVTVGLHPMWNARVGGNWLQFELDTDVSDITYTGDLDYSSFMALLDWHPFTNGFRISGGVVLNNNDFMVSGTPSTPTKIGTRTYTPAQVGTITGDLDFEKVAPYAGIGFGHPFGDDGRFSFVFDLGVIFQSTDVALTADGLLGQNPVFMTDLQEEEEDVQDALDDFEFYPVLAFGVAYRF